MFDHVTMRVSDLEVARRFYVSALAALEFADAYFGAGMSTTSGGC